MYRPSFGDIKLLEKRLDGILNDIINNPGYYDEVVKLSLCMGDISFRSENYENARLCYVQPIWAQSKIGGEIVISTESEIFERIKETIHDKDDSSQVYNRIARLFYDCGEFDISLQYYHKAFEFALDDRSRADNLHNVATALLRKSGIVTGNKNGSFRWKNKDQITPEVEFPVIDEALGFMKDAETLYEKLGNEADIEQSRGYITKLEDLKETPARRRTDSFGSCSSGRSSGGRSIRGRRLWSEMGSSDEELGFIVKGLS